MCTTHKTQSALQKILILFRVFSTLRTSWHLTVKQWTHNYKQNMTSVDRSAWFSSAAADIDCEKKVKSHIWASEQHLYLPTNRTLINICKTSSFLRSLVCWWLFWPINCLVNIKTRKAGRQCSRTEPDVHHSIRKSRRQKQNVKNHNIYRTTPKWGLGCNKLPSPNAECSEAKICTGPVVVVVQVEITSMPLKHLLLIFSSSLSHILLLVYDVLPCGRNNKINNIT